jgi:solute:Na+ symporter, SSS family
MLSVYDYCVIGFYFAFMLVIGWVCRRFIANTSDYFRGGGKVLWWMVGSSAFMLSFSAWTFTGGAGKAYQDGPIILVIYLGNALGFFFNYLLFAPRFRQMRVVTGMQAVRLRFGAANEQFFTWLQIPLGILYAGIWLYGLSTFISSAFDVGIGSTILATGAVVVVIAVLGGSWAVVAGDFIQMLILMPVTIVAAVLAISHVGGLRSFFDHVPHRHFAFTEECRGQILFLWCIAIVLKQCISTNTLMEASRYLSVKDTNHARRAALLGMALFIIGPLVWFVPPMVSAITHPDLHALFPAMKNPADAAYVAACFDVMPNGMAGLLISGIFAATMSAMDGGLNKNAGAFIKNFYQVVLRPGAKEPALLFAAKLTTFVFGALVIAAASIFNRANHEDLFNLMQKYGGLVVLPYSVPLVLGVLIKRAPAWAGWTTVVVGLVTSWLGNQFLTPQWIARVMGWRELSLREGNDWTLLLGVLLNAAVCAAWFLGSCWFANRRPAEEKERVDQFFKQMTTPVDFQKEMGAGNDAAQFRTLGLLCLVYGSFIALMLVIPNPLSGRLGILFCMVCMMGTGAVLYWLGERRKRSAIATAAMPDERKEVEPALKPGAKAGARVG